MTDPVERLVNQCSGLASEGLARWRKAATVLIDRQDQ